MPLTVLVFFNTATWSRFVRSSMLEVLRQDYVRTARGQGAGRTACRPSKHALRNALIPFVTILSCRFRRYSPGVITETVFACRASAACTSMR